MITVKLRSKEGNITDTLKVDQNKIADAGIVSYNGTYYAFAGMQGRFFEGVIFHEVNPPVELEPLE